MTKKILTAVACCLMFASATQAQTDFREALQIAFPATVSIDTGKEVVAAAANPRQILRRGQFAQMNIFNGLAMDTRQSGFVVGSDLVATQLSSDIDEVTIKTADGKELSGKVVVRDNVTGTAIVKVDDAKLVSLVVGAGNPEAGLPIVITRIDNGTPAGKMGMIASGPAALHPLLGFTQLVSADLSQSEIGAPIVDATGVVVGMVGSSEEGALLCLPTDRLIALIDAATGEGAENLKRGLVGVAFGDGDKPRVTSVNPDSPAHQAGFIVGDRVLKVGDYSVRTAQDILAAVAMSRSGDEVVLQIERDDETLDLAVTLKEHPRQAFAQTGGMQGAFAQQAWELRDGKLVPLNQPDNLPGIAPVQPLQPLLQRDFEKMFENFPDRKFILPQAGGLEGFRVERSELEDSLRELEKEKSKQADELKDVKKKLRDLQDKLQDL